MAELLWPVAAVVGAVILAVLLWKSIGKGWMARQANKEREGDLEDANKEIEQRSRPLDWRSAGKRMLRAAKGKRPLP